MKNLKRLPLILILTIIPYLSFGQGDDMGAVPFLTITPDARSAAMAGTGTALEQGAFGIFHNPAANLNLENRLGAGYSFTPWQKDIASGSNLHAAGIYYNIDSKNGLSIGFRHFSNHEVTLTSDTGEFIENFKAKDMVVDIAYTRHIIDNFYGAVTVKYVNSDYGTVIGGDQGNSVAFDLGFFYKRGMEFLRGSDWSVGLKVANLGMKIDYGNGKYELPGLVKAGGAVNFNFNENHKLLAAVDLGYQLIPSSASYFDGGIGLEYNLFKYGLLRGGYHFDNGDGGLGNYATVGVGVKAGPVRADFFYWITQSDSPLKNTLGASIGFNFK